MILGNELRAKFCVFLFLADIDQGTDVRGHLALSGYEVFLFRDHETLIDRVREAAPHIIVFEVEALQTTLSEFVEKVLSENQEVLFLPLAKTSQANALAEYRDYNFAGLIDKGDNRDLRVLWAVDQICSELYLQYQNEHLLDVQAESKKKSAQSDVEMKALHQRIQELESVEHFSVAHDLKIYEKVSSKEEVLDAFLHHLEQKFLRKNKKLHAMVLKFLPTVQSFVATQGLGIDIERLKGVGARLLKEEADDLFGFLESGQFPVQLIQLVQQGMQVPAFVGKALLLPGSVEALFIFWTKEGAVRAADFENEFLIFQLVYRNLSLSKRLHDSDTVDPITELQNRDFYLKKLDEEVARARRLHKAVSVVKISIDHFVEIQQAYGVGSCNSVLRTVATLINRSSRVNDFTCRTDDNEVSLILPHSPRKGAAIRAERIRRMIENHSFNLSGHRVTLSCGISEYPTLSSTAEELETGASQALSFILEKGGNKVCLYRARQDFKPDFDIPPV